MRQARHYELQAGHRDARSADGHRAAEGGRVSRAGDTDLSGRSRRVEQQAGITVESGDIVFVRNGRWARRAAVGPWATGRQAAGLHASVVPWLRARDVAMLGGDTTNDVLPSGVDGVAMPIHQVVLVALGMPIFDNLDLEALAEETARLERWEFLFVAAPLAVDGATGSPLNPIAMF